jgi:hypothetical protein
MTCLVAQQLDIWETVAFAELDMPDGSTPELAERLKAEYAQWLYNMKVTGDSTGRNRSALIKGNLNHYRIFKQVLELKEDDIVVPNQNLALSDSRVLCNSVLKNAKFSVTKNCKRTIKDLEMAMVDSESELIKNPTFPAHHFDTARYLIHMTYPDFIRSPYKYRK